MWEELEVECSGLDSLEDSWRTRKEEKGWNKSAESES